MYVDQKPFFTPFWKCEICKSKYQNNYNTTFCVRLLSKASKSPKAFDKSDLQTSVTTKNNKASD